MDGSRMLSKHSLDEHPGYLELLARNWFRHLTGAVIAIGLAGPIFYEAIDRERPWTRVWGEIDPTPAGGTFAVRWHATPLARACPGTIQVEIISHTDAGDLIWPVLQRPVSSRWVLGQTYFETMPWILYRDVPPGKATYRVTTFWNCNLLQTLTGWSINQVGPDIEFDVLPEEPK